MWNIGDWCLTMTICLNIANGILFCLAYRNHRLLFLSDSGQSENSIGGDNSV